ncbi:putative bifunctional diguanylate cyclase/phosphodiesterase [Dyella nitratireducens]|uniref:Bifunctional diguanylate cyclase/phosphodiesterase n=1 Tax=Dyella nitratireducens TaxID=1849580 RepID=A0ABQ1GJA4_9GAMM|nr:EAL domain-containing protein [Dyella nitratireducens]GGA44767.1 bifunctional diguanylate cyclase/phosphodiesterase [Dyella nitratireducens]GLQ41230.1 bifunctional diguanylate cyclase/phosphodiesterase [Dyella nitratireducens]
MSGTYNPLLVAVSLVVATLASYTALDLASRISMLKRPANRHAWLAGGAAAMGVGIWSMHFVGMLAFSLPIPLGYDPAITGYSLLIAIFVSWFALYVITRAQLGLREIAVGGVLMGLGIAGMHYTGMAALRMQPGLHYDPSLFTASIAIAVVASTAALWIARALSDMRQRYVTTKRAVAAFVMGVAITGMHYTGMAAADFMPDSICGAANGVDAQWLATTITLFTFAILTVTLILSRFDVRTALLTGSVTELNDQIVRMANHDALTDLPNRRALVERIETVVHNAKRAHETFAVLFLDIDGFKTVNDSLGHSTGDEVLKAFSLRLQQCVREGDTVARLGGDEFVVLMENVTSPHEVQDVAQSVLDRMGRGHWRDEQPIQAVPSIGIALFPRDGETADILLKNADAAMYEAKRAGRATWRFFEASMNAAAMRTLQIQNAIRVALDEGYFSLRFQPKFSSTTRELVGAEALIRLNHPELGLLLPSEFIPDAERSGQIVPIGQWVVREACRQIRHWQALGLPAIKVAVNLSPRQMAQPDLIETMVDILRAENIPCEQIMFEITEAVAMHDAAKTTEMVQAFQHAGFEIAIDDFGTGYSSLAYLERFRVKQLKIDRFFTSGLDAQGHEGRAIVSAIIALAHSLNMEVVAEGVETPSQLSELQIMACDQMQGYLLAKPMTADAFGTLLEQQMAGA